MAWWLDYGKDYKFFLEVEADSGEKPTALKIMPRLQPELLRVWNAFWRLDSERPVMQGAVGRIPFMAMVRYAEAYDIRGDDFSSFERYIGAMDTEYVDYVNNRPGASEDG